MGCVAPQWFFVVGAAGLALACATSPEQSAPRTHLGAVLDESGGAVSLSPAEAGRSDHDRELARARAEDAARRLDQGDLAGAELAAEEALRLDPGFAIAHSEWARAAEALGRPAELVAAHYSLGARLAPEEARPQLLESAWHERRGDGARALEAIERALRANPSDPEALTRKGDLLAARGDPAAALAAYDAALAVDAQRLPALVGKADAAERAGDPAAAEAALRAIIAAVPNPTVHRAKLIALLRRTGQTARADAEQRLLDREQPKDSRKLRKLRR